MSARAIGHGTMKSRMKPMMIPAIPSFACGVMLTPFTQPGPGAPRPAQLLLAYRAQRHRLDLADWLSGKSEYAASIADPGASYGSVRCDDLDAGGTRGQRAAQPQPARPAHRHAARPAGDARE